MIYNSASFLTEDFGPGPRHLKIAWVINFHKVVTLFIIYAMMVHFDNFSTAAWVYLGLHGIYGYCWLVKDFGFRDGSFEARVTYGGAIMTYLVLVAWYWLLPYLFLSRHIEPSGPLLFVAVAMHTQGITWMIAADCQKHFSLKYRKGLITGGVFSYTRNPNYFGEVLIYASYAILANHWLGYAILAYAILFFYSRMHTKDASISRYPEWDVYAARSSRLIPFKLLTEPFRDALPTPPHTSEASQ
jgi:protein-S-isoprenylcysteine O-methyltransferase Ste14